MYFFQNPLFSIFSLCFWNSNHKTKVARNSILPTGTSFQRPNSKLKQCFFQKLLWGYFWPKQKSHDFFFWFSLNFPKPKFQNLLHPFKNGSDSLEYISDPWSYFVFLLSSLTLFGTGGGGGIHPPKTKKAYNT